MKQVFQASITCRLDIIGFITMISIATGGIGGVIVTGTIRVGIENIPDSIGLGKNFIGHRQVIHKVGEDRMTKAQQALQDLVTRGRVVNQLLQGLKTKGQEVM
jgi:hypothetical protein